MVVNTETTSRAIASNRAVEAPAPLALTVEGTPRIGWEETGDWRMCRREVTRQTYRVEGVELIEHHGYTYRVDHVRVNVNDATDVEVALIRQRKRGGDFVKRDGLRERSTRLPALAARITAVLAPSPEHEQAPAQSQADRAAEAESWLYELGATRYFARAFGEYVGTSQIEHENLSAAKRAFDYDPRGRELLDKHGSVSV